MTITMERIYFNMTSQQWASLGFTVMGASHKKKGTPNQDAVCFGDGPTFVAVSDGHGAKKYIRSHLGSFFAVNCIKEVLKQCTPLNTSMKDINPYILHIKSRFLLSWQQSIDNDLHTNPFTDDENSFLVSNCSQKEIESIKTNPRLAYGCTFLCAVVYNNLILILHHGDGDILGIYGDTVQDIVQWDNRNFAGNTLSLGSLKDAQEMGHQILTDDSLPSLITISTDGIKNSYNDKIKSEIEQFYKIPIAISMALKEECDISYDIQNLLTKITTNGSGDDVTLGILYNMQYRNFTKQVLN